MKKIGIVSMLFIIFVLAGCTSFKGISENINQEIELSGSQSLGFSTFLASGFLDTTPDIEGMALNEKNNVNVVFLTSTTETSDGFQIDSEIEEVNIYFNKLKVFMEKGYDSAIDVKQSASTKEGYDFEVTYTVDDVSYVIYYSFVDDLTDDTDTTNLNNMSSTTENNNEDDDDNDEDVDKEEDDDKDEVDLDDKEEFKLRGLLIIDGVEYELVGANEIEENETKTWFKTADFNKKENYVRVQIKEESGTQKFEIETRIDGVENKSQIKFHEEDDETKVELRLKSDEEESVYNFKKEIEDGKTMYKFEYKIGEVKGNVKIYEIVDELGNVTYQYKIEENGKRKEIERKEKGHENKEKLHNDVEVNLSVNIL